MVLVTGASGQVGKHLLQALSARGISARAWIHSKHNEEAVLAAGAKEFFIGDLNSRRGQIRGMEAVFGAQEIRALVPLSEMFGYSTDLRSKTQGRGNYTMEPHSYVEVPKNIADKIISERTKNN